MKDVGIDLIKLFRNFKFEKSTVILTGYMAIAGYFFDMFRSKSLLLRISLFTPGRQLPKSGLRSKKKVKNGVRA